jgi:integrase/recombinase XerC
MPSMPTSATSGPTGASNSDRTEVTYRQQLERHAEDIRNRDPAKTGRDDVKRTLARWEHPNTRRRAHAALTSFYDWAMEEGMRKDNPARQIRRAKPRQTTVYRLTRRETVALMDACRSVVEHRVIFIGLCAGLRNQELRGLGGGHFARVGWVWVSADIAKGRRERWVPVLPELADVVDEIVTHVRLDEYVIAARVVMNPPRNTQWRENPTRPASSQFVWRLVDRVAKRAGIAAHIHPHLLRHA